MSLSSPAHKQPLRQLEPIAIEAKRSINLERRLAAVSYEVAKAQYQINEALRRAQQNPLFLKGKKLP